jgi:fumarate reductase subunit C
MTTPTLPARVPDGWWTGHAGYRYYMLFGMAGGLLAVVSCVLLVGVRALGEGAAAWARYQAMLGSPPGLLLSALLMVSTGFFAVRWLRVGVKVGQVQIGPMPAPAGWLLLVAHFAGLVTISLVLLLLLSGVVV